MLAGGWEWSGGMRGGHQKHPKGPLLGRRLHRGSPVSAMGPSPCPSSPVPSSDNRIPGQVVPS